MGLTLTNAVSQANIVSYTITALHITIQSDTSGTIYMEYMRTDSNGMEVLPRQTLIVPDANFATTISNLKSRMYSLLESTLGVTGTVT